MTDTTAINKKYPYEAKNCSECRWLKNDTGNKNVCEVYGFKNLIPEIKGCDRCD
jgi:hypothetical protein